MPEALYRLDYDTTIDDAVDVSLRLANRSHAFRKQLQTNIIVVGTAGGLGFFAAWLYFVGTSPLHLALAVVAGIVFGVVFAATFRHFFAKDMRKQQRKMIAEQFGGKPMIHCELELRPEAIWVRQAGMEMVFPWAVCTGVLSNREDVEITFTPGICVIRNRHFASPAERQDFLEIAHRPSVNPTPSAIAETLT